MVPISLLKVLSYSKALSLFPVLYPVLHLLEIVGHMQAFVLHLHLLTFVLSQWEGGCSEDYQSEDGILTCWQL